MKYIVDTCSINKLVDGFIMAEQLSRNGKIVALQITVDELNSTKDSERKVELLEKFAEIIDEVIPTPSPGVLYESIKNALDERNKGKRNNSHDALIAEVAAKNGYVLLTTDFHLYQVAEHLGIGVEYWTEGTTGWGRWQKPS